ncbi:MAG: Clostripain-related protein [Parcubacteria group bacterium GW2011_GWA1_40_21]|nr:MAG: Clostripain-related protein [Parcubacteria group bacterium GW2011_GWA1_40_21]
MVSKKFRVILILISILIIITTAFFKSEIFAAEITATIKISLCGDSVIGAEEQCDGATLGGATCVSRGFSGGALACGLSCEFNTLSCYSSGASSSSATGGGGGGGGGITAQVVTNVIFSGRAYPKSVVTLLKDAQIAATTVVGEDAKFQITLSDLSGGNYIFSVYGEDKKGFRSSLLTFPVGVTSGVTTRVSGIFVAPTIAVDKIEVKRGDNIAIFGQSVPKTEITISVNSEEEFFNKTDSDSDGVYLYNFDTSVLEMGQHLAKSKSSLDGEISSFSKAVGFTVGAKTVMAEEPKKVPEKGDLNNDKRVNLVDFSVAAYWYKRPSPPTSTDLNNDGKVNLVDFSIMAFYWTG